MAASQDQILKTLQMIEMHTKMSAGASAKSIGQGRSGDLGNESTGGQGSSIDKSAGGLIKTYTELNKALESQKKAIEEAAKVKEEEARKNAGVADGLEKLRKNIEKQIGAGAKASTIRKKTSDELDKLGDIGKQLKSTFKEIDSHQKGDFLSSIDEASASLDMLSREAEQRAKKETAEANKAIEAHKANQKQFWDQFNSGMKKALATMVARVSQGLLATQASGFEVGDSKGIWDTLTGVVDQGVAAFNVGASIEEMNRFAAANRESLAALTGTSLLTAQEGTAAVEQYGDQLKREFGMSGAAQLQAVGQSLATLTNLGIVPTTDNLQAFGQSVENVAKTSNMTADEIFAEFSNLAQDSDFQSFFLAMGENVDATSYLSDSFLHLQKTVGLNIKEFTAYQQFLAKQRNRTGSERVVQAAYIGQLGAAMGLSGQELALLQQGTAFRESLSAAEGKQFDALFNRLGVSVAQRRGELAATGDVAGLQALDIMRQGAALPEQIGVVGRKRSGVVEAQQQAQQERLKASIENTNVISDLNSTVREWIDGFIKSPLAGVGFLSDMTGAVFKGTLLANKVSQTGAGLFGKASGMAGMAKWLGGAGLALAGGAFIGDQLAENTQIDEWIGQKMFDWFGDSDMSVKEQRIRKLEDELLQQQITMGQQATELREKMAKAEMEGNAELVKKLDEQLTELRKQYEVMTREGEERILSVSQNNAGRTGRNVKGR